tara:strand:+ start:42 stop:311 length:270 start_codon:yes stop_codon:yes gene_type:complete
MLRITKDNGQYVLNHHDQVTVFDSAHISGCLLILKRKVTHFNPNDISGDDFIQDVGVSTLFDKAMKESINQLKELGMVITNESEKAETL